MSPLAIVAAGPPVRAVRRRRGPSGTHESESMTDLAGHSSVWVLTFSEPVMTTPARPTSKADVAAIVGEIMEEQRKNAEQPAPSGSPFVPSYVVATLVVALCAWAWIAPPAWLVPKRVAAPSREYREASARVALALNAQRIEAYRASNGRLPSSKQEVGILSDQISYDQTGRLTFELSSRVDGQPVTYKSTQPRDRYLAEAMTALSRARR